MLIIVNRIQFLYYSSYFDKYQKTSYYATLKLRPKPTPKPSVVAPKARSEMRASYATLSKIALSNSDTELRAKQIFSKYNSAVFMIYAADNVSISQGSGFFVSSDGIGISNYHVFKGTFKGEEVIKLFYRKQMNGM